MTTELKDAPLSQAEIDAQRLADEVKMLGEDQAFDYRFADRMLRTIVRENRQPNFTESSYFKGKLGWDKAKVNFHIKRIGNVMRDQAIAGRKADREALEAERQTANEIAEREVPKLDAQIEKLVRQRNQLEKAASNATRRCAEVEEALQRLRSPELLRTDVLETYNERLQHFGQTVQAKINALLIEIRHREICLNKPDDLELSFWLDAIATLSPDSVGWVGEGSYRQRQLLTEFWPNAQTTMLLEIESMKSEVAVLESQRAAFEEEQRMIAELYILEAN